MCLYADLLDGVKDDIGYNSSLVDTSSITDNIDDSGLSRIIVFTGSATDATYAEVYSNASVCVLRDNVSVCHNTHVLPSSNLVNTNVCIICVPWVI